MPQNIVETPSATGTIIAPSPGDPVTSSSIVQGLQPVANRLAHAQAGLADGSGIEWPIGEYPTLAAHGMQHSQNVLHATTHGLTAWEALDPFGGGAWRQTAESDSNLFVPITRFPHGGAGAGSIMTTGRVYVSGGTGRTLPIQFPPSLRVWRRTVTNAVFVEEGVQVDTSATAGAYEAIHPISVTGLALELHSSDELFLELRGESGTNALMNQLTLVGAEIVTVVTRVAP